MFYVVGTAWTNANSVRTMTKIIAPSMAATEKLEMEATPTLRFATHQCLYWTLGRYINWELLLGYISLIAKETGY